MPPKHEGERFTATEVTLIRDWILEGAKGPLDEKADPDPREHWAFKPPRNPRVPEVKTVSWVRNPIDAYVLAPLEAVGLRTAPEASKEVLIRRLYMDLVGVPPSMDELSNILKTQDSEWYEQLVDRLLADVRYGERWGRHWMDIWRYSDWWGLGAQLRNSQKHMWHFRDWIIESLNADSPYDKMVSLMLAADEIAPSDPSSLRATGFLARNWFLFNRNTWMEDTVEHVGKGFLGLTMNCSKCHDHKYDPISQPDFYAMRAIFEPHHIRMDLVPGELDPDKNGIPRAFDGAPHIPTYRFERGEESKPDKSKVIEPNIPHFFGGAGFSIQPVSLPAEAFEPERQPWVLDSYVAAAESAVNKARDAVLLAEKKLAQETSALQAETSLRPLSLSEKGFPVDSAPTPGPVQATESAFLLRETFEHLSSKRWRLIGGNWKSSPSGLEQRLEGKTRSAAILEDSPQARDLEINLRFTTFGGAVYRSVGISMVENAESGANFAGTAGIKKDDSEIAVYVSSSASGSKVQAAYRRGPSWVYPPDGVARLPLPLGEKRNLNVRVQGNLLNVALDGKHLFAWRSPLDLNPGELQLFTFDAQCTIHELELRRLAPGIVLADPNTTASGGQGSSLSVPRKAPAETTNISSIESAQFAVDLAKLALEQAVRESESVQLRVDATRCRWEATDPDKVDKARTAAIRSERVAAAARAAYSVGLKKSSLAKAAPDKRAGLEKELKNAETELIKARQLAHTEPGPSDVFRPLSGSKWVPTRFLSSGKDDPDMQFPKTSSGRRKALAEWVTHPQNPLTSRVAVNHIWGRHFGFYLVSTPFDFGRAGAPPTHPDLLDWLACEFASHGWSMKHIHRLIVTSSVYRMTSSVKDRAPELEQDPDNAKIWRRLPVRLEAEAIRDSIISLSGEMDGSIGGPSVPANAQAASKRRSLYFFHSNNDRNLFLTTFDGAMVKECYRREQSIVPQQALAMINSALATHASRTITHLISQKLETRGTNDDANFVETAFQYITGMRASAAESQACQKAFSEWKAASSEPGTGGFRERLVWVLLNHNDFITVR